MVVRILISLAFDILTSLSATKSATMLTAVWAIALVPALWFGTHHGGIHGAAIAHALVAVGVALPLSVLLLRLAGVSLVPVVPALLRPAVATVLSASVISALLPLLGRSDAVVQLVLAGGAGMLVYLVVAVPRDQLRQAVIRLRDIRTKARGYR